MNNFNNNPLYEAFIKNGQMIESDSITFVDPVTGQKTEIKLDETKAKEMNNECKDSAWYEDWINNTDFGEYGKHIRPLLHKLNGMCQKVGNVVLKIGKVVLELVLKLLKKFVQLFPTMILGGLVGFLVATLISSIPLIGWLLSPIAYPLLTTIGALGGCLNDLMNMISNPQITNFIKTHLGGLINRQSGVAMA